MPARRSDSALLDAARDAARSLHEAEKVVSQARANRDAAIRDAVADGHSLRVVADAVGMSWSGVRTRVTDA